jgi:multisubunit Na+/H+ antiporter MnhE subunit
VHRLGHWPAPFGIVLVIDRLSVVMLLLAAVTGFAVLAYEAAQPERRLAALPFFPLFQFLLMGLNGAFLTGDLFNLFVFFEVLLIASYGLLTLGASARQLRSGVQFMVLNLLSSALFLFGIGTLYGLTGTLNFADLAGKVAALGPADAGLLHVAMATLLVVFATKAALIPLAFWLPDSYPAPPAAISAMFGGIATKVGVYALLRVFSTVFESVRGPGAELMVVLGVASMLIGVLGAVAQYELRRLTVVPHREPDRLPRVRHRPVHGGRRRGGALLPGALHAREMRALPPERHRRAPGRRERPAQAARSRAPVAGAGGALLRRGHLARGAAPDEWLLLEAAARVRRARGRALDRRDGGVRRRHPHALLDDEDLDDGLLGRAGALGPAAAARRRAGGGRPAGVVLGDARRRRRSAVALLAGNRGAGPRHPGICRGGARARGTTVTAWIRHPLYAGVLAVMWMVLQRRLMLADLAIGYVVALVVVWVCRDFWTERVRIRRPLGMLRLLVVFLREIVVASLQVAWIIVQPRMPIRPALIVVPLALTDDLQITMLANMITLTPGTLTLDVAPDRSALYVHCLAAPDPDAVRAQIAESFEQPLIQGVTCSPL